MKKLMSAVAVSLLLTMPAGAHEGHKHGGPQRGGVIVDSGHHVLEVVAKDGTIDVFVAGEDGKPEETAGAKATAVILSGGKKSDVTLAPGEGNVLKGTGDFTVAKGTTIVLTLTMPGHEAEQSRLKLD